jgi:hypothetical protein
MTWVTRGTRFTALLALGMTLVIFRVGPASAVTVPANDDFDHATVVAATPFSDTVDLSAATTASDDPLSCATPANTVWYSFTAPVAESVVVTISGTASVSAFSGSRGALTQVACGSVPFPVQWLATAGTSYHIMVSAWILPPSPVTVQINVAPIPANDDFAHATTITALPFTTTLDTTGASSAPDDPQGCGGSKNSVWYSFTPAVTETIFAAVSGGISSPSVSAYTGSRGSLTQVACGGFPASTSWVATAGITYYLMAVSTGPFSGSLSLQVSASLPPSNDDFNHATVATALPFSDNLDVSAATTAADDPTSCATAQSTVWYSFTPTVSETFAVNTGGTNFLSSASVYTGSRGSLTQVACEGSFPTTPAVKWVGVAGVTYHVMIADFARPAATDRLTLTITGAMAPANDDFDHATVVSTLPFTDNIDASAASSAADDPTSCGGSAASSLWYSLTPTADESVVADTTSSTYAPAVSVYTGTRGSLTQVACGIFTSVTSFHVTAGVTYHIMVTDAQPIFGSAGHLTLSLQGFTPPGNDDIDHPTAFTTVPFTGTDDVSGAGTAADDPTACGGAVSSVWFRFTPTVSETFSVDPTGSTYQTAVSVYTGARGSLTQIACQNGFVTPQPAKWAGTAGVTYYIMVANSSFSGPGVNDHLTLTVTGTSPPRNDDFNHATKVTALPFTDSIDVSGGTAAADDPTGCATTYGSVWYDLTAPVTELVIADVTGSTYAPSVSVWTGSRGSLTPVTCGFGSDNSFQVTAGVKYYIMVTNPFGPAQQLVLHLKGILPPVNDDIRHAKVIGQLPFTDRIDTTAATAAAGDPTCFLQPQATVWYKFTAPTSGMLQISSSSSGYPASVSAYSGPPTALTQLACDFQGTSPFAVTRGATYYFMVSSFFQTGGDLHFAVTGLPDIPATSPCTKQLTGTITNGVTVGSGTTCLTNATVSGDVTVSRGAELSITNSTIRGRVSTDRAAAVAICNSSIVGILTVRSSTGPVLIGDGGDGAGGGGVTCPGNTLGGRVELTHNDSGVELGGNTVRDQVTISDNNPNPSSVLAADDATVEVEANHITGRLNCSHNKPAPVNDGLANTVSGLRTDQCQAL